MTTRKVVFFNTQYVPATETEMYVVPAATISTIDKFVGYNSDAANHVVTVKIVPADGTPTGTEFTIERKTIAPGQTWLFPGIVGNELAEGDSIHVAADMAGVVVIRSSGRDDTVDN